MTSRIFDRNNYTKRTLDTFEIMASYFVNDYYNHIYIEAKTLKTNKNVNSITEGYKHTLNLYRQGLDDNKSYKKLLSYIHSYFGSLGYSSMSFTECLERIAEEFIPKDYYSVVSKSQKHAIIKRIICNSNAAFIEKVVRRFLPLIIDNHEDADNIRIMQDEFIDVLILERESTYQLFVARKVTTNNAPRINVALFEKMQNEIKNSLKERAELKKTIIDLKKTLSDFKKVLLKKEMDLRNEKAQIEVLNSNILELKNELGESNKMVMPLPNIEPKEMPNITYAREMQSVLDTSLNTSLDNTLDTSLNTDSQTSKESNTPDNNIFTSNVDLDMWDM